MNDIKRLLIAIVLVLALFFQSCDHRGGKSKSAESKSNDSYVIHSLNEKLSESIIQDGFPPPVASRCYAYPNIAAFEVLVLADHRFRSMAGQLNDLKPITIKSDLKDFDYRIAMIKAFTDVAIKMVYRDYILEREQESLLGRLKNEVGDKVFENSIKVGAEVAEWINKWAATDKFKESRNYPRWEVTDAPGTWVPTAPKYGEAIEPHWGELRTFVMDSASQFSLFPPPASFSTDTASDFYKLAKAVYDSVAIANDRRIAIAKHWDCNPAVSEDRGHLMGLKRQLNPGGHWMGITRIVTKMKDMDLGLTTEAYARVSIALADGFKSVWDAKYKFNLIRPETYINRYIDPNWRPLLETPLFPEHPSAHSTISRAAATVLTDLLGDNFAYIDSVEVPFGNPPRSFTSFYQASNEAAISRVFGGIHYTPACYLGIKQGEMVGENEVKNLKTRN